MVVPGPVALRDPFNAVDERVDVLMAAMDAPNETLATGMTTGV